MTSNGFIPTQIRFLVIHSLSFIIYFFLTILNPLYLWAWVRTVFDGMREIFIINTLLSSALHTLEHLSCVPSSYVLITGTHVWILCRFGSREEEESGNSVDIEKIAFKLIIYSYYAVYRESWWLWCCFAAFHSISFYTNAMNMIRFPSIPLKASSLSLICFHHHTTQLYIC